MSEAKDSQRLDKWLFFARVLKSREKAQALIKDGHVRLNGKRMDAPAQLVRPGDVLTISLERRIFRAARARARRTARPGGRSPAAL